MSDAVVIGSGPNGLSAAVVLARAGFAVTVIEAEPQAGGGLRTLPLTAPGYRHDLCSAVHPMALTSPFFTAFEIERRVEYAVGDVSYAHGIDKGTAAVAYRNLARTADGLGVDGRVWRQMFGPLSRRIDRVSRLTHSSLLRVPDDPLIAASYGLRFAELGSPLWRSRFRREHAPALFAGVAAHAVTRLPSLGAAAAGIALAAHAHAGGWPVPVGGAQAVADAMIHDIVANGGRIETGRRVEDLGELGEPEIVIADTSARALAGIAGSRLPERYRRALARFRYGNAVAKVDYALDGPVPWANPALADAPTVHLGGTAAETLAAENAVAAGRHPDKPYVLITQPSLLDRGRAPAGGHVLWAYTHVPSGSRIDREQAITDRIEEFAPGFRDRIVARSSVNAMQVEGHNANYVGGDISAGAVALGQLIARPVWSPTPWRTPHPGLYLASASAVPGPGIHGMGGFHAARTALRDRGIAMPRLGITDNDVTP